MEVGSGETTRVGHRRRSERTLWDREWVVGYGKVHQVREGSECQSGVEPRRGTSVSISGREVEGCRVERGVGRDVGW